MEKSIKRRYGAFKSHLNRPSDEQLTFTHVVWVDPKDPENIVTFTRKPKIRRLKQEGVFYKVPRMNKRRQKIVLVLKKRLGLQHPVIRVDMHTYKVMKYRYTAFLKKINKYESDARVDELIQERLNSKEQISAKEFLKRITHYNELLDKL